MNATISLYEAVNSWLDDESNNNLSTFERLIDHKDRWSLADSFNEYCDSVYDKFPYTDLGIQAITFYLNKTLPKLREGNSIQAWQDLGEFCDNLENQ